MASSRDIICDRIIKEAGAFAGRNLPYLLMGGVVTVADQVLKRRAEKDPELFGEVVYNKGFAGERLSGRPEIVRKVAAAVNIFSLALFLLQEDRDIPGKIKKSGLSILTMGALSNTLDRIFKKRVVDYIPRGKYVYNLGDFAIGAGSVLYAAGALLDGSSDERRQS